MISLDRCPAGLVPAIEWINETTGGAAGAAFFGDDAGIIHLCIASCKHFQGVINLTFSSDELRDNVSSVTNAVIVAFTVATLNGKGNSK